MEKIEETSLEEKKIHSITITIFDREKCYKPVGEVLHRYADDVLLRVGYPVEEENIAIIFIITKMTNDELGSFTGKLGQIDSVKVRSVSIKTNKK